MRHRPNKQRARAFLSCALQTTLTALCVRTGTRSANAAYQPHRFGRPIKEDNRYFVVEQILPALHSEDVFNSQTERAIPASHGEAIPVTYTNSPRGVSDWLAANIPLGDATIGFDVESVPNTPWIKGKASFVGPATVQLATPESVLVVHLLRLNGRPSISCVPVLEAVLADASIVKAGTGIDQDMIELYRYWGSLTCRSRLDLGGIGISNVHCGSIGLKKLTKAILGVDLIKSKKISCSNWSQVPLSEPQLNYCARDAWAGAAIMGTLANLDPGTFSTTSLVRMFSESELSMAETNQRSMERKRAKIRLKYLLDSENSESVQDEVDTLRAIMKEQAPLGLTFFDVEPLGISLESNERQ